MKKVICNNMKEYRRAKQLIKESRSTKLYLPILNESLYNGFIKIVYSIDFKKMYNFIHTLPYKVFDDRNISKQLLGKYIRFSGRNITKCLLQKEYYITDNIIKDFVQTGVALESVKNNTKDKLKVAIIDANYNIIKSEFTSAYTFEINPENSLTFTKFKEFVETTFNKLITRRSYNTDITSI